MFLAQTNRLTELLKIDVEPDDDVYITYVAEVHTGIHYALPAIKDRLWEVAARTNESRVVVFNFGLHDIKEACVDYSVESMARNLSGIPSRTSGDCVDFYRSGLGMFLDFLDSYPADLKIFRTTNAGWMRWGQFGFAWPANDGQLNVFSHHSAKTLNDVAIETIQKFNQNKTYLKQIRILDFYWPSLARPDNTDVDHIEKQSAGSHLVHPGLDTMRLLARIEVMMIMRHFCSDFLDEMQQRFWDKQ